MIDREARDKLAELLRHLASGQITVGEYRASVPSHSLDRGVRATIECSFTDYTELAAECLEAPLADDFRYRGQYALPPKERLTIAQWILFLQSDQQYTYQVRELVHRLMPLLTIAALGTIPLAGIVAVLSRFHSSLSLGLAQVLGAVAITVFAVAASGAMLGALTIFFHGICAGEDIRAWPFHNRRNLREALKHPKLLRGPRSSARPAP